MYALLVNKIILKIKKRNSIGAMKRGKRGQIDGIIHNSSYHQSDSTF